MFDNLHLTNMLRSEVEHISETGFPLDVFPDKIQDIILNLARYENFNIEYTTSIILSAVATAAIPAKSASRANGKQVLPFI